MEQAEEALCQIEQYVPKSIGGIARIEFAHHQIDHGMHEWAVAQLRQMEARS